jgi:hypothetical protein
MVKDGDDVYLSREDLLGVMNERLSLFPKELEELRKPKIGKIVGINGNTSLQPSDEKEIERHKGKEIMLKGIISMLNMEAE